jgi:hypothetical protein
MRGDGGSNMQNKVNLIHLLLAIGAVVVVGVTMAATGFSRDTFMGLVCLAAALGLVVPNIKNIQNPPPGYSRGSYVFMFVLAALLAVGGLYVLIFGIPQ